MTVGFDIAPGYTSTLNVQRRSPMPDPTPVRVFVSCALPIPADMPVTRDVIARLLSDHLFDLDHAGQLHTVIDAWQLLPPGKD